MVCSADTVNLTTQHDGHKSGMPGILQDYSEHGNSGNQ